MQQYFTEQDWKLFRSHIPAWQEAYMEKLNREYAALLAGNGLASEKFWALDERIKKDKRRIGVVIEMRRSLFIDNLVALLYEGVITEKELEDFSEELRDVVLRIYRRSNA